MSNSMLGNKDIWMPLLVGGVVLAVLFYVAVKVSDLNGTVLSVDTKVSNAQQRLDRIAEALPAIQIRIANEELQKQSKTLLVTTKPTESPSGEWTMLVHVVDVANDKDNVVPTTTFTVKLANASDRTAIFHIKGFSADVEAHPTSASQLISWSADTSNPVVWPDFLDANTSVVFHRTSADKVKAGLYRIGPAKERQLFWNSNADDWKGMLVGLQKNDETLKIAQ